MILIFVTIFFVLIPAYYSDLRFNTKKKEIEQYIGRSEFPLPFPYGVLKIEIDYSKNLSLNKGLINYFTFNIFNETRILTKIIWDQELNTTSINFSFTNCSEYAILMNSTRTYQDAIHVIILNRFVVNNHTKSWGICIYLPQWEDMIQNYSSPSYTGCLVAYDQILEDTNDFFMVIKCICHEIGHALGIDSHDKVGIMKAGDTEQWQYVLFTLLSGIDFSPYYLFTLGKGLYFSTEVQKKLNPYSVWGIHQGFDSYKK